MLLAVGSPIPSARHLTPHPARDSFRLPLRTEEQAASSLLSKRASSSEGVRKLMHELNGSLSEMLLFTQHLTRVELLTLEEGACSPLLLGSAALELPGEDRGGTLRRERRLYSAAKEDRPTTAAPVEFRLSLAVQQGARAWREEWMLVAGEHPSDALLREQLGGPNAWVGCAAPLHVSPPRDPQPDDTKAKAKAAAGSDAGFDASAGAKAGSEADAGSEVLAEKSADTPAFRGRAFCFLPLPQLTGLGVHINGAFALTSNRRELWHEDADAADVSASYVGLGAK
jgi:sacsin